MSPSHVYLSSEIDLKDFCFFVRQVNMAESRRRPIEVELWPLYRRLEAWLHQAPEPEKVHPFRGALWGRLPAFLEAQGCPYERLLGLLPQSAPWRLRPPLDFEEEDALAEFELEEEWETLELDVEPGGALHYAIRFRWQGEELIALYAEPELLPGRALTLVYGPSAAVAHLAEELAAWRLLRERVHLYGGGRWVDRLGKRITPVPFQEVYLEEELKRELFDAVRLVFEGDLLPRLGLPRRRGLLLCGPPGNGKTLCIRALLHEYPDASLLYLVRPETGVGSWAFERLLEDAGELLRRSRRCVIALEDVEVFFESAQERSAFLNALDGLFQGVPPQGALLVVATTNYPEKLDAALLQRPHRFDRVFVLRPPGAKLRRRYLRERAQIPLGEEELEELVRQTKGLSFAYLQELIVSAHYAAAFAGEPLGFRHYLETARRVARQRRQGEALERWGLKPKRSVGFLAAEQEPDLPESEGEE